MNRSSPKRSGTVRPTLNDVTRDEQETEKEPEPEPEKRPARLIRLRLTDVIDGVAFALAAVAAIWLAWVLITESFDLGWWIVLFFVLFWVVLAYLVLPRLHRILTGIYVPNYFIGRARTSDGLLGDPINLALLGSQAQLQTAMDAAAWTLADPVTLRSGWRIVASTLLRRSYDEAPVSPLFVFGRQQDLAFQQEVAGNPAKRHHVRFWKCPPEWRLPGGARAGWLGAGTFDRSVGFSLFTLQITHKIDANTDIERDHITASLTKADPDIEIQVIRDFSTGYHARNGGGDSIATDGNLPVVDLTKVQALPEHEIEPDVLEAAADKRPASITMGCLLLVLRGLAWVYFVVNLALHWRATLSELSVEIGGLSPSVDQGLVPIAAAIGVVLIVVGVLFELGIAVLIYRGSNGARMVAMVVSAFAVVAAAVDYFNGGTMVNLRADLFGLPLDLLVLLALSAHEASAWTRRKRALKLGRRGILVPAGH
jgi:hypothetical protein